MNSIILLPGIGNSGASHWQTAWEASDPSMQRFRPGDWDQPDLDDWVATLDRAVAAADAPPLLVAHSLACLLVAHWAARSTRPVRGAFLVAVPDPDGPAFPAVEAATFCKVPDERLPFPALIVASSNDPYGTVDHAAARARAWQAGLVVAGALGHVNGASNLGAWPQGRSLFEAFRAGVRA